MFFLKLLYGLIYQDYGQL